MKLYHHKTDGGAEYLTDKSIKNPNGTLEGTFKGAKYIIRIDGDITKDAELIVNGRVKKTKGEASHTAKINELIDRYTESLRVECDRLLKSGAIDPDVFDPEMYNLAKVVLTAAIRQTRNVYYPAHDKNLIREIKNLECF